MVLYNNLYCCTDTQTADQYKEVYRRFYAKLVQSLPLADAHFRALLVSKQMFSGDLFDQVDAKETNAEKNEHFLANTIDTSLNVGIINPFISLLQVMESFGSTTLKSLAEDINTDLLISTNGSQTQQLSVSMQPRITTKG